jgi:hypothetical protein
MRVKILHKDGHKVVDLNRRQAIRERCLNCSGWSTAGVKYCTHTWCHLHPYRMGTGKQKSKNRDLAIRKYCLWCCCDQINEVRLCPSRDCALFAFRLSSIDHSVEIPSLRKKRHIEATLGAM